MELKPHDLIEVKSEKDLRYYSALPDWVEKSIAKAPFVVVRRARAEEGLVAVGVRGSKRNERFAAFLPVEKLIRRVTPEQLAQQMKWKDKPKEIFRSLEHVNQIMNTYSLNWGPAGSVGFELASMQETTTNTSDIDIIIRIPKKFTPNLAKEIDTALKKSKVRVDVQIEAFEGAFSLSEYASPIGNKVLMRTKDGPKLKEIQQVVI